MKRCPLVRWSQREDTVLLRIEIQDLADEELALTQSGGTLSINGTGAHQAEPYAKNDGSRFACTLKLHAACGAAQYAVPKRTDFSADATPDLSVTCSKLGALAAQLSPAEDSTVTAPFSESLGTPRPDGRGNDFSHGGTERISPMKGPQRVDAVEFRPTGGEGLNIVLHKAEKGSWWPHLLAEDANDHDAYVQVDWDNFVLPDELDIKLNRNFTANRLKYETPLDMMGAREILPSDADDDEAEVY